MATQIDEAILAAVGDRWTKVAMVIARTARALHGELPSGDQCCDEISQHIQALVADGQLAARGNIKDSRHQRGSALRRTLIATYDKSCSRQSIKGIMQLRQRQATMIRPLRAI